MSKKRSGFHNDRKAYKYGYCFPNISNSTPFVCPSIELPQIATYDSNMNYWVLNKNTTILECQTLTISPNYSRLRIPDSLTLTNKGTIINLSIITVWESSGIINTGTIITNGGFIENYGNIFNDISGIITNINQGVILNIVNAYIFTSNITNKGIINNDGGGIINFSIINNDIGGFININNNGAIFNFSGNIFNRGTINNNSVFNNNNGAIITNTGGRIILENNSVFNNNNGAVIYNINSGYINTSLGIYNENGTLNNADGTSTCGLGTLIGTNSTGTDCPP